MDWAPDPSRPGLVALGDGRGAVVLVGLADLEDWARHMPVWHHRGAIRQVWAPAAACLRGACCGEKRDEKRAAQVFYLPFDRARSLSLFDCHTCFTLSQLKSPSNSFSRTRLRTARGAEPRPPLQAVHSVADGLRSKVGKLATSAGGAAAGALSEAKFLARDIKDSRLVRGIGRLFGRGAESQ